MANKRPDITEQTKTNLRQAFWRLYEEKPLAKISVKQITDLAGYNRGTFYLYFKDIYDLLEDIESKVLQVIEGMMASLVQPLADGENARAIDLGSAMTSMATAVSIYGKYVRVLLSDRGDPAFKARFKQLVWPVMRPTVVRGKALPPQEEKIVKEYCLAGLIASITAWLSSDDALPIDSYIALLTNDLLGRPQAG